MANTEKHFFFDLFLLLAFGVSVGLGTIENLCFTFNVFGLLLAIPVIFEIHWLVMLVIGLVKKNHNMLFYSLACIVFSIIVVLIAIDLVQKTPMKFGQ